MTQSEGSEYDRLFYPFLFKGGQASTEDLLDQAYYSTLEKCREVIELRRATLARHQADIVDAGAAMAKAFAGGATLFGFGNGGSATDVQDIIADLMAPSLCHWQPLPAIALTNDVAVITAVGNDVGFDNIFTRQIIAFGKAGDIALGFSTSGSSRNVLAAFQQAKKQGMLTVGLAGYDGGQMAHMEVLDFCFVAASDHIPRIQEAQATTYHALLDVVQAALPALKAQAEYPARRELNGSG